MWWLFAPYSVSMCSVIPAVCANEWKKCSNISVSISPSRFCENSVFHTRNGRPEMSSATRVSVSSIGDSASA